VSTPCSVLRAKATANLRRWSSATPSRSGLIQTWQKCRRRRAGAGQRRGLHSLRQHLGTFGLRSRVDRIGPDSRDGAAWISGWRTGRAAGPWLAGSQSRHAGFRSAALDIGDPSRARTVLTQHQKGPPHWPRLNVAGAQRAETRSAWLLTYRRSPRRHPAGSRPTPTHQTGAAFRLAMPKWPSPPALPADRAIRTADR
jgi:hypothetical protein